VELFIRQEGNGVFRMPPWRNYLPPWPELVLPLATVDYSESALAGDPRAQPVAADALVGLHGWFEESFAQPGTLGYVKQRRLAAGFDAHKIREGAFGRLPSLGGGPVLHTNPENLKGVERWALVRLELVSLLKHERPVAYVSRELPRMEQLRHAPTRELTAFEAAALKELEAGEVLATDATLNRIRMLGDIRASKQCLDCHDAQRGQLLGAFSYELLRDPPLKQK
jgi:hypothetical protein